jgi:DNA-binding LacI/PurR family transcriptional regulator
MVRKNPLQQSEPGADNRPATLIDVAKLAGVSRSTASSVLNGACQTTRTSPQTRERVRRAADELAYRPNAFARSLRRAGTRTIGFYTGFDNIDARNPFVATVLSGLYAQCDYHLCDLLIHRGSLRSGRQDQIQEILGGKVDGVVLWTHSGDPVIEMLATLRFPAVAIADRVGTVPSVTADDAGGARLVARRLADRGHKRVLYRLPRAERPSGNVRCTAFLEDALALGLRVDVCASDDYDDKFSDHEVRLLTAPQRERPTAVVCWNDSSALQAYREFQLRGWAGRFALIGFDGFDAPGLPVTLSTVNAAWSDVARTAVDMVHEMAAGQPVDAHVSIPVSLVDGDTD